MGFSCRLLKKMGNAKNKNKYLQALSLSTSSEILRKKVVTLRHAN
jgi:hypothetical protein